MEADLGTVDGFVGRAGDLALLERAALDAFSVPEAHLIVVRGESGVGKSRLLAEVANRAAAKGAVVAWGWSSPDPAAPELWPFGPVVRACAARWSPEALAERLGHHRANLPFLQPAGPGTAGEAVANRFAVAEAVTALVREVTTDRPLVLVFDDLQWADRPTLDLLHFLMRALADSPVLVLGARRAGMGDAGAREDGLEWLSSRARYIDLVGLDEDDTWALMRERTGRSPRSEVVALVHRVTGGNPLFVEQWLSLTPAGEAPGDEGTVPATVLEAVRRRLLALDRSTVALLEVAAVAGPEIDASVVAAAAGVPVDEVHSSLAELTRLRVVSPGEGDRATFAHDLLREAVLGDIDPTVLGGIHRSLAEALAELGSSAAERVVHALAAQPAFPSLTVIDLLEKAGLEATGRSAHAEAASWYGRALELIYREPAASEEERLAVLLTLAEAQMRAGHREAGATFDRARKLARAAGRPIELARATVGLAESRYRGPGWETQLVTDRAMLEEAVAGLVGDGVDELVLAARLHGQLAACFALNGDRPSALRSADAAAGAAAGTADVAARQAALVGRRWALLGPGRRSGSSAATEQLHLLAVQTGDAEGQWRAARWAFQDGLEAGDPRKVRDALRTTTALADRLAEPALVVDALVQQGTVALLEGRWEDLAALHRRGHELAKEAAVGTEAMLGQDLFHSREKGELRVDVLRLILDANAQPLHHALVCWGTANAGPAEALAADVDRFFAATPLDELADGAHLLPVLAMTTEAVVELGDPDRATLLRDRLRPYSGQCVVAGVGPYVWTGATDHYLGLLEAVIGDPGEAVPHLELALSIHRRMGARPWVIRTELALAQAGAGVRSVADLVHEASRLGMTALAARAAEAEHERGTASRQAIAARGQWTLRREGESWLVSGPGVTERLRDRKGLRAIAVLLSRPNQEVHVLELAAAVDGVPRGPHGDLGPLLDGPAKEALRRRIGDLQEEIESAEQTGDSARSERAHVELDLIIEELARSVGLGGRDRVAGSAAERARVNLTRSIRSAVKALAELHPEPARHLSAGLRTGMYCAYQPDPLSEATWNT